MYFGSLLCQDVLLGTQDRGDYQRCCQEQLSDQNSTADLAKTQSCMATNHHLEAETHSTFHNHYTNSDTPQTNRGCSNTYELPCAAARMDIQCCHSSQHFT